MNQALDALRAENPARAARVEEYFKTIREWARYPEYFKAAVATYAVRRIEDVGSPEWQALVEEFGEPAEKDWAKAQELYGPDPRFPGLKEA